MVKDTDTISEMYDEKKKREEQTFQALCQAAKEFDEEKKRERNMLIGYMDHIKEEALFAFDTGGEISIRRDTGFGIRIVIKHRDIGHEIFSKNLRPENKKEEEEEDDVHDG